MTILTSFLFVLAISFQVSMLTRDENSTILNAENDTIVIIKISPNLEPIILAEPNTLPILKEANISIETSTVLENDIKIFWKIEPADAKKFQKTQGFVSLITNTSKTFISIRTRNTGAPSLNQVLYTFYLERIAQNISSVSSLINVDIGDPNKCSIRILPSNYPFGVFQFSDMLPLNLTFFRSTVKNDPDLVTVNRKMGKNGHVFLTYEQVEIVNDKPKLDTKITDTLEFREGEWMKPIGEFLANQDDYETDPTFPKLFYIELSSIQLLSDLSFLNLSQTLINQGNAILPTLDKKSSIFVRIVEDITLIEFDSESLEVFVDSDNVFAQTTSLKLKQSSANMINQTVQVNIVTLPAYKNKLGIFYHPARPGVDFEPNGGPVFFTNGLSTTPLNITIYPRDVFDSEISTRMFTVVLLGVENCENCQLGSLQEASVYIKYKKQSIVTWNNETFSYLSLTKSNKICGYNREFYALKIEAKLKLLDQEKLPSQVVTSMAKMVYLDGNNSTFFINPGKDECLFIRLFIPTNFSLCYNLTFELKLNTSFVINRNLNISSLSPLVETLFLFLPSFNCCQVSFKFLDKIRIEISAFQQNQSVLRIPLELFKDFCPNLGIIELSYNVEYVQDLNNYLNFSQKEESSTSKKVDGEFLLLKQFKTSIDTNRQNSSWFIELNTIFSDRLIFQTFELKINLVDSRSGNFRTRNDSLLVEFTNTILLNDSSLCSAISLDNEFTKFSNVNFNNRILNISLKSVRFGDAICSLRVNYSLIKLDTKSFITSDIFYLNDDDDFSLAFLSNSSISKQISVKEDAYLDNHDQFFVNITSLFTGENNTVSLFSSPQNTQMKLVPSYETANGPVIIEPLLIIASDPYNLNSLKYYLVVNFLRFGSYGTVRVDFSLGLVDLETDDLDKNDQSWKTIFEIKDNYVDISETSKRFSFDLSSGLDIESNYQFELQFLSQICYYELEDACLRENKTILELLPNGIIKFDSESQQIIVNATAGEKTQINLKVLRDFGSQDLFLVFSVVSETKSADFFFSSVSQPINFKKFSYESNILLELNQVFLLNRKDFYVYLTNTFVKNNDTLSYQNNTINEKKRVAHITLLPTPIGSEFGNVFAFAQSNLVISCVSDKKLLNLSLLVFRIGSQNEPQNVSVMVKTAGFGDNIPQYIYSKERKLLTNSSFLLALPKIEYQAIDTRAEIKHQEQSFFNLSMKIFSNFSTDSNVSVSSAYQSRYFFIYLSEPSKGASLIEPSANQTSFSPYLKIEMRKFPLNSSALRSDLIEVGFSNVNHSNQLNQSISLIDFNYKFGYKLNWTKTNRSANLESIFHLKWQATLLDFEEISLYTENLTIREFLNCPFFDQNSPDMCQGIIFCNYLETNCSFELNFKPDMPDFLELYGLQISLSTIEISNYETKTLFISIRNESREAFLYLKTNLFSRIGFSMYSLFNVNDRFRVYAELNVERTGLLNSSLEFIYGTQQFANPYTWFDFNGFRMYPAIGGFDFDEIDRKRAKFAPNQKEFKLNITLQTSLILSNNHQSPFGGIISIVSNQNDSYVRHKFPKMFQVVLYGCTNNNCDIDAKTSVSNVTLINEDYGLWQMYSYTLHGQEDESLRQLNEISKNIIRNLTVTEIDLIAKTIENILVKQYYLVRNENSFNLDRALIESRRETMLNILCRFMNPKWDELIGDLRFFQLLEDLLFLNISDSSTISRYLESSTLKFRKFECAYSSFNYACASINSTSLLEVWFEGEFFQMNFSTRFDRRFRALPAIYSSSLFQMCLIEMVSTNWFGVDLKRNLLENKAISLSLRPLYNNGYSFEPIFVSKRTGLLEPLLNLVEPVVIRMPLRFSIQTIKKCSILQSSNLAWINSKCQTTTNWSSLDCTCSHQSIYGIYSRDNDLYYGFQHSWLYASIAFHLFVGIITIFVFIYRLLKKKKHDTFSIFSVCSIQVLVSNMLTIVTYLIVVLLSPSLNVDESGIIDASNSRCMVMGIVFHFLILLQFSSMFMNALLFYFILIKGYFLLESSKQKKGGVQQDSGSNEVIFYLSPSRSLKPIVILLGFSWLIPLLIIAIFNLIASLVYKYVFNYSPSFIYSDVLENYDICFIKNIGAYLLGACLPSLILFTSCLVLLALICINIRQKLNFLRYSIAQMLGKKAMLSILRDTAEYSLKIKLIVINAGVFLTIFCVNIIAAFQIRTGHIGAFILFCCSEFALAIILGLYLAFYVFVENKMAKIKCSSNTRDEDHYQKHNFEAQELYPNINHKLGNLRWASQSD